jgi:hypothetical protein
MKYIECELGTPTYDGNSPESADGSGGPPTGSPVVTVSRPAVYALATGAL